jgi:hypothetical protein
MLGYPDLLDYISLMTRKIDSIERCIDALGGRRAAAAFLRVGYTQVSNMICDGHVTSGHHLRVYLRLKSMGCDVDIPAVFGVDDDGVVPSDTAHADSGAAA